jgi:hypothetical protein
MSAWSYKKKLDDAQKRFGETLGAAEQWKEVAEDKTRSIRAWGKVLEYTFDTIRASGEVFEVSSPRPVESGFYDTHTSGEAILDHFGADFGSLVLYAVSVTRQAKESRDCLDSALALLASVSPVAPPKDEGGVASVAAMASKLTSSILDPNRDDPPYVPIIQPPSQRRRELPVGGPVLTRRPAVKRVTEIIGSSEHE